MAYSPTQIMGWAVSFFGVGPDIPAVSPPTELDAILCPGPLGE